MTQASRAQVDEVMYIPAALALHQRPAEMCIRDRCCGIENMEHALTQIPFAAVAAGLTTIGFLICGFAF